MKLNYYDNSHLCGECTGAGCSRCAGGLSGTGNVRFPLSPIVARCVPPCIENYYAWKLNPLSRLYILTVYHA